MAYQRVYENRINWRNLPNTTTPLDEINLNKMDYADNIFDMAIDELFVTKAEQSDLLQTPHIIEYDSSTATLRITYWNGSVQEIGLNSGGAFDIPDATQSAHGLMSANDKIKLDGVAAEADNVSFSRNLTSGTKVGTITINGTSQDLYAPNGGSSVSVSRNLTSGTQICTITVDGTTYYIYAPSGGDSVSVSRNLTSGTKIGTITVNGYGYDLYCANTRDFTCGTSSSQSADILEFVWS